MEVEEKENEEEEEEEEKRGEEEEKESEDEGTKKVFIVAVLAIFPLVPKSLSNRAYRLSFMGTACSSVYYLYALYGRPKAWTLQAVQVYFQSVIATKDFNYFIYCLTFVTSHLCLKFALIPILCRSLERIAKFLRHNFSRSTLYRYLQMPDSMSSTLERLIPS
ncbi:hypothetical protein ES319_A11G238300v1 [Gossypium barbadense]|uniref:Uncharacterized protein n=2 Tax=Gossypium TaxID=3633 RepID=A0A5J5TRY3_GOSBA|nr:hypothetical protein ES319_A11G238300v1 [Gossypium barbadense]TYG95313.1 hypothetical protein ES288_A11G258000v1 [Gossypium darwinii]